ncbi:phage tail protein [Enterobacter asburiae]|uniref:phage tail-collar fiber domain-containing protein n=1 Tax=Enterobacter asburiae TaxID=61645 RepID=UPI002B24195B|nr:phage tail protein [Enterobacter asburiae]MEB2410383.1 phage tail protein [Enterobacter asburiae]
MSQTVITTAFEALKAQQAAANIPVVLDEFVFANVPNLNITDPIDPAEAMPVAGQIVHRASVGKTGVVNDNAVVYSITLGADVGDFDFNWVGLRDKTNNTLAMIVHAPVQQKVKNAAGTQGNVLTRSFLMEYDGAKKQTEITTPASTWQIDFTARLAGMDERQRAENIDIYGAGAFFGDGFLVKRAGNNYSVTAGAGYVGGLRAALEADQSLTVTTKPVKVWVDTSFSGTLTSVWQVSTVITVADTLADYVKNDVKHYVFAVAQINADGSVTDLRKLGSNTDEELAKHIAEMATALAEKQPLDGTLTSLSGKNIAQLCAYLGLIIGSNTGNVVTSGSTQPVYKTTLPNIGYAELPERGVFANADGALDSVTKILTTLLTRAGAGGWTLGQSVGTYLGAGGTPDDLAHVLISTDGAGFTRRWYLYNNGKLVGPAGDMASVNFVQDAIAALVASSPAALDTLNELAAALGNDPNFATTMLNALAGKQPLDTTLTSLSGKNIAQLCAYLGLVVGSNTGNVVTSGSTQPVYQTTLPAVGYADLAPHGLFAHADAMVDSVTKILTTLLTKPGVGGWTLGQSVGTYLGAGGTPDDLAHVLISTDGAGFSRRWYLYNNGKLVGPAGEFALQEWVNNQFLKLDGAKIAGFALNDANRPYIRHKDSDAVVELQRKNQASLAVTGWSKDSSTGLIEMWGTVANVADDTPAVVSFPTAFPNACLAFTPTLKRSTKTNDNTAMLSVWGAANDNSSATVIFQSNTNGGDVRSGDITWRATGY